MIRLAYQIVFFTLKIAFFFTLISVCYAQTWEERSLLKAVKQEVNDNFGRIVAISKNYAAVGSSGSAGENKWPVYIYKKNSINNQHILIQGIQSSDSQYPIVPTSLAISDSLLVVGSQGGPFLTAGSAFIFKLDSQGKWNEIQRLAPFDPNGLDKFGSKVAIWGNTIVVSSPGKSIEYQEGAVYVFEKGNGSSWIEKQKLMASDFDRDDFFGLSVAIQNDEIFVGAPYENNHSKTEYNHGAVYFFKKNESGTWEEKQKIVSPSRVPNATFGWSLDVYGDDLVIGAEMEEHYGVVYFFQKANGQWGSPQRIPSPSANSFAHDVALANSIAVVSQGDHLATNAFTYVKGLSGKWSEGVKIYGPSYTNFQAEKFGNSIDLNDGFLIIGAPDAQASIYTGYNPPRAGEAHVYQVSNIPLPFEKATWLEVKGTGSFPVLVDFDNDDDLDLFVAFRDDKISESRLYIFDNGQYLLFNQRFPMMEYNSASEWLDVNGDGWLDLLIKFEEDFKPQVQLFVSNKAKSFTSTIVSDNLLSSQWYGAFHFSDYDNDTDLDLIVQAKVEPGEKKKARILKNDGHFKFAKTDIVFEGVVAGSNPWFDYNQDGFMDFLFIQQISCSEYRLIVYKNNSGLNFERLDTGIRALSGEFPFEFSGEIAWGDYDDDGDSDLIWSGITSCSNGEGSSDVIVNNQGIFTKQNKPFKSLLAEAHLGLIDFDNNGGLDLITYGDPRSADTNSVNFFRRSIAGLEKMILYETPRSHQSGGMAIGDIEGDGDIDVAIAGEVSFADSRILIYKNNSAEGWSKKNLQPSAPKSLQVELKGKEIKIIWQASSDDTTPTRSLTYNIQLTRNDSVIIDSYSNKNGNRKYFIPGNAGHRTSWLYNNLEDGHYSVSVQAIDNAYSGSSFSTTEFEISTITSIEPIELTSSVLLFPNPTKNNIQIESSSIINRIDVFNQLGSPLYSDIYQEKYVQLDMSVFPTGVFFIAIHTDVGRTVKKVVRY